MEDVLIIKLIIILTLCIIFIICTFLFVNYFYSYKNIKRIEDFSLKNNSSYELSFVDKLLKFLLKIVKKITSLNKKSVFLKKYSKKLDKYLIYSKNTRLTCDDYISIKILYTMFVDLLYLVTSILKNNPINIFLFIILSFVSFFIIDGAIIIIYKNKRNKIEDGLLQAIVIMNSAFKSGKNIYQAINIVKTSLPSPIKEEFEIISKDINYGLDLTTVFERFYNRVKVEEVKYITSSLSLLNKTGGNIVTVFNMIEKHFYDKLKIKNELNSLTSSSKMLYRMLIFIPFIFVFTIYSLNPNYFKPLVTTNLGFALDIIMLILYVIYILVIKKITKVEKVWK